jgi:hypothetical protein
MQQQVQFEGVERQLGGHTEEAVVVVMMGCCAWDIGCDGGKLKRLGFVYIE